MQNNYHILKQRKTAAKSRRGFIFICFQEKFSRQGVIRNQQGVKHFLSKNKNRTPAFGYNIIMQ